MDVETKEHVDMAAQVKAYEILQQQRREKSAKLIKWVGALAGLLTAAGAVIAALQGGD